MRKYLLSIMALMLLCTPMLMAAEDGVADMDDAGIDEIPVAAQELEGWSADAGVEIEMDVAAEVEVPAVETEVEVDVPSVDVSVEEGSEEESVSSLETKEEDKAESDSADGMDDAKDTNDSKPGLMQKFMNLWN